MIPIHQTRFGPGVGNCFTACLGGGETWDKIPKPEVVTP